MRRLQTAILLCVVLFATALLPAQAAWAKDALVMGVHPYKPAQELHTMFRPIADYISKKLGVPVELKFGKTYEDTAERLGKGEIDFSYLGPTTYAKFSGTQHFKPLVQIVNNGKPSFYGVIVVKKGSPIKTIKDLKGKALAFGDRNSTVTHVVPLYMLMNEGMSVSDLGKHAFLGSHDNIALNVIAGTFDAAGLMPDIAEKYKEKGLEVVMKQPEIPEHVFAATKSMDAATFKKIQDALLAMDPALYKNIKGSLTGLQKFNDKDFDGLRKILDKVEKDLDK
jgi:phosphonate transport system substrate-binding protein